ncbi:MAG TPA: hypothetical protein VF290_02465 [Pyrinomonadaceae bacterium]
MASSESSVTVEQALAELREMFPGQAISIEFRDYRGVVGCEDSGYVRVSSETAQYTEASLAKAMAELRAEIRERRERGEEI